MAALSKRAASTNNTLDGLGWTKVELLIPNAKIPKTLIQKCDQLIFIHETLHTTTFFCVATNILCCISLYYALWRDDG